MLVCSVSLRPPRAGITADIAEAAAALDDAGTGQVVFATLVDDPASVGETVDAYLGLIMVEAASSADVIDASSPATYTATIVEAASAADTQSTFATSWNASDKLNVTLSNSNLTATATAVGAVRSNFNFNSGKYYWECTGATWTNGSTGIGAALAAPALSGLSSTTGAAIFFQSGAIFVNAVYQGAGVNFGPRSNGDIIGIAIDYGANLIWFRVCPSGNWNLNLGGSANPATGSGGLGIGTITTAALLPAALFNATSDQIVANFGGSAFSGAVPSGFTAPP